MRAYGKLFGIVLLMYCAYVLATGVFSYLLPVRTPLLIRQKLGAVNFKGTGTGPDKALVAERCQQAFSRRIELVRSASSTLDITIYTVKPGVSGALLFAEILAAAERGVHVRLLLSGLTGKLHLRRELYRALRVHPNVEIRVYNPFNPLTPWRWNALMHDKIMIADRRRFSLGGRNFGDEYCTPPGYTGRATLDREVFVVGDATESGSVVREVVQYFEALWVHPHTVIRHAGPFKKKGQLLGQSLLLCRADFEEKHPEYYACGNPLPYAALPTHHITLVSNPLHTGKKQPWVGWQMRRLVCGASHTVVLQTPYTTPNRFTLQCLQDAARQADVRLLTNSALTSPNPAFGVYLRHRSKFLQAGVRLWEYIGRDGTSIHGKSAIIDNTLCAIGSFNMDDRSLYIDTETMLVIHGEEFTHSFVEAMQPLWAQAMPVQEDNTYPSGYTDAEPSAGKRLYLKIAGAVLSVFRFLV